jgi:arylsulfatase A-like enzyme
VEEALVGTLDVAPTLATLAGLPGEPRFTGRSLVAAETGLFSSFRGPRFHVPKLEKRELVAQEAAFRTLPTGERVRATVPQLALYSDWVVLIDDGESPELYDLKDDPEEEKNLAADHADGVERLREKVHRIAEKGATAAGGPDAEQLEQLRSLGYVQ